MNEKDAIVNELGKTAFWIGATLKEVSLDNKSEARDDLNLALEYLDLALERMKEW